MMSIGWIVALIKAFGAKGATGSPGPQGPPGADGADGLNATIDIGTVTKIDAGGIPTVTNTGTPSAAIFNFGLVTGETGPAGPVTDHNNLPNRDQSDAHPASAITNTPAGNIVATTVQGAINELDTEKAPNLSAATWEVTGFVSPADVVVTYDPSARTITLTGTPTAYYQSSAISALTSGWVSSAHTNTTGNIYWLYYDGVNFTWLANAFPGFDKLLIAMVIFGATDKFAIRECHGLMQWQAHREFHNVTGTYRGSGGTLAGYTVASTTAADRRPSVAECVIHDEDLPTTLPAIADDGPYTQMYLTSTGTSTFAIDAADIVPLSGNNPYYNSFSTPNWGQTLMPANSVASVWLVAVPVTASAGSQKYRFLWVQPQWVTQATGAGAPQMATAASAEALRNTSELSMGGFGTLASEYVFIAKVIIQYVGGNWSIYSVSNITGTRSSQSSMPSGNYLSTVTTSSPITGNGTVTSPITVPTATTSVDGYLTATDWNTFNQWATTEHTLSKNRSIADGQCVVIAGPLTMGSYSITLGSTARLRVL